MHLATALGLFLGFWSCLYLLDIYFRAHNISRYLGFVEATGIVISPFQVRWYTNRFQPWLMSLSLLRRSAVRQVLSVWFAVGVAFAVTCSVAMLCFLTFILWRELNLGAVIGALFAVRFARDGAADRLTTLTTRQQSDDEQQQQIGLVPIIPGVNVPWEHMPLFLLALVIAGVVHELGHAVAAINDNVGVNGFGVFLLAIYPGAFTEIENGGLESVTPFTRLKIYCAGIWHNFALALVAVLLLVTLPSTLSPAYMTNKGVLVNYVSPWSGINGPAGLKAGHVVYGINYCKVYNEATWFGCLNQIRRTNYGYCIPRTEVGQNRMNRVRNVYGELHCCSENTTQTHLCFYYKPPSQTFAVTVTDGKSAAHNISLPAVNPLEYSCLPARYVTDHHACNQTLLCGGVRTVCVYPALFNSTKLQRFFVANLSRPVLFIGFPDEVGRLVAVSSYVPRFTLAPVWLPPVLELLLKYLLTFSLALGLLNAVPCYGLDGQHMAAVLLDVGCLVWHRKWARRRKSLCKILMRYSTFLLVANVLVALWKFLRPLMVNVVAPR